MYIPILVFGLLACLTATMVGPALAQSLQPKPSMVGAQLDPPRVNTQRLSSAANCGGIADWAYRACGGDSGVASLRLACSKVRRDTEADCERLSLSDRAPHVVSVYQDGSFAPEELFIEHGDTVLWSFYGRGEAVIPVSVGLVPQTPAGTPTASVCRAYRPYDPADPNEFTGPMPRAVSGIFVLNPQPAPGDDSIPEPFDPVLSDADFTASLLRIKWSDVHLGPGVFDWRSLDEQVETVVDHGKFYSLVFKAGQKCAKQGGVQVCDGTPDWIFDPGVAEAEAVKPLSLMSAPSFPEPGACGVPRQLGSPADPNYRSHYFELLAEAAEHLMENNAWYRALAYIKPSGANLFSAENRLPKECWSPSGRGLTADECDCVPPGRVRAARRPPCICNPQVWSVEGDYTPAALSEFYSLQTGLLARAFPDKDMSYMLIQAGFPLINNAGEYEGQEVVDAAGNYSPVPLPENAPQFPLPGGTEQTRQIIQRGFEEHKYRFAVQHNALKDDGTPNNVVETAKGMGLFTGYQTVNNLADADQLGGALADALDFNAVFVEVYQKDLISDDSVVTSLAGKPLGAWDNLFHELRRGDEFRQKAGDPFPYVHGHTFTRTDADSSANQTLQYVVTPGCADNPQIGRIHILP